MADIDIAYSLSEEDFDSIRINFSSVVNEISRIFSKILTANIPSTNMNDVVFDYDTYEKEKQD